MAQRQIDTDLSNVYYDPDNPGSFGGVQKLFEEVKHLGYTKEQVSEWLKSQDTYSIFKPVKYDIQRPKVIASGKNYMYDADTANMVKYKYQNSHYAYFLVCMANIPYYLG